MLYPEEHALDLKKWIVKRLENTSDADADVLADYVLALLRHDGDIKDVRRLCETEIPDFLKEDSSVFVNDVFEAIAYKSYLPGAPQPRPRHEAPPVARVDPHSLPYDEVPMPQAPQLPTTQNGSRKRSYNDWAEQGAQNGIDPRYAERSFKQPRRGGGFGFGSRGGRAEGANGFNAPTPNAFPNAAGQLPPPFPPIQTGPDGKFDAQKALDAMSAMFSMGFPGGPAQNFQPLPQGQSMHQSGKRRPRCRDYEAKGYCVRGYACNFEHGEDSTYVPPGGFSTQAASQAQPIEEYDPKNAFLSGIYGTPALDQAQQPVMPGGGRPMRGRGGKQQNGPQKRRAKASFSADGPITDRTKSTIVVENIPEENFTEDQVHGFFSQFGNILEVSMQSYKRLAVVKFDAWAAANAAYTSPKVVFDNRFVKIFWYKDSDTSLPTPRSAAGTNVFKKSGSVTGQSEAGAGSPAPEIDIEEFRRKQEEAQKIHEEKQRKLQEVEARRQELEKRQQELVAKQKMERAKLEAKLSRKSNASYPQGIGQDNEAASSGKPANQTEALRAQLAALEAEAKQLGLDPDAMNDESSSSWGTRGGGFARGRGGYNPRARGYAPRGARGAYRGRGSNHAAYAAYSLDNRPRKITLTGVDFTIPEKDETLRQYLFGIGEFTDIQTTPTATEVTFKDRKTAEKFFNGVMLNNKEISGIAGQVEPTWSGGGGGNGSAGGSAVSSVAGTPPPGAVGGGGVMSTRIFSNRLGYGHSGGNTISTAAATAVPAAKGTSVSSDDKDVSIVLEHAGQHQQNDTSMDYDVADENQWDIE